MRAATTAVVVVDLGDHGSYAALDVDDHTQYVTDALAGAKGDLYVATAADTVVRFAVGADNTILICDSATTEGIRWA